ncbi:MAG TPA: metallophosphoesterase family protein [Thermomicrobiales bacterium]|nr:metallophosphoesterase family protein [Thermomicrobiales bacterium]
MRILVLSDIHANLTALEAVLAAAGAVDAIWNLGDTVGYGPRPEECVARSVELGMHPILAGNHDLACIGQLDMRDFNPAARQAAEWTAGRLSPTSRRLLGSIPSLTTVDHVTLAHGSPRDPVWEYVVDEFTARDNFHRFDTPLCLVGHSHVALYAELKPERDQAELGLLADGDQLDLSRGRFLFNPGSVGQPRDRDPRAAYALLDLRQGTITAHRVAYTVAATQRDMAAAGLPERLIHRLALGV